MTIDTTHTHQHPQGLTLILGGSGKVGRRVLSRLDAAGVPTRLGSRRASLPFEWNDRSTWPRALSGVRAVFISYVPDLAVPGAVDDITTFVDLAKQAGVEQLVLLSGRGEPEAHRCEQIVQDSGLKWTICRAAWFMQNFTESFMRDPVLAGELAFPGGSMVEPWIDCEDIAEVAVAALLDDQHHGQLYELTGPELLSFADIARTLQQATGRLITYTPMSHSHFLESLSQQAVPQDIVELMDYLFAEVFDGRNAVLGDGVQRALGRPARPFASFAKHAVAHGLWSEAEGV